MLGGIVWGKGEVVLGLDMDEIAPWMRVLVTTAFCSPVLWMLWRFYSCGGGRGQSLIHQHQAITSSHLSQSETGASRMVRQKTKEDLKPRQYRHLEPILISAALRLARCRPPSVRRGFQRTRERSEHIFIYSRARCFQHSLFSLSSLTWNV